ncbi:hypothetical protein GCM10027273_31900 [Nocardioides pakistanensis]
MPDPDPDLASQRDGNRVIVEAELSQLASEKDTVFAFDRSQSFIHEHSIGLWQARPALRRTTCGWRCTPRVGGPRMASPCTTYLGIPVPAAANSSW